MTKVKVCGLRRPEDMPAVNAAGPDYAGCILAQGFRRTVDRETAKNLRTALNPEIPLVGVFVNDTVDTMASFLEEGIIQIAQLHGKESEDTVRALKERTGKPVWKVFKMNAETDIAAIEASPADMVLLDAGAGSGETFDWSLVKTVQRPFILAGGLTPENVKIAIETTHPYAVDTSSGVETDGQKDSDKIAAYVLAARGE